MLQRFLSLQKCCAIVCFGNASSLPIDFRIFHLERVRDNSNVCRSGPLNIAQLHTEHLSYGIVQVIVLLMKEQTFGRLAALCMPSCKITNFAY
jgi:hypothetical protein